MNYIYTGTPGSGKSLHAMQQIEFYLKHGKNVIANFPIHINNLKTVKGHFYYLPNDRITVKYLINFSKIKHDKDRENQTLIVFDEASVKFNSRDFKAKDRMEFLNFFSQHRKYGYNICFISQSIRQIDRQIRDQFELEVKHRKLNNYKVFWICPFPVFVAHTYNLNFRDCIESNFFLYKKKYGDLYDTFYEFDKSIMVDPNSMIEYSEFIRKTEIVFQIHKKEKRFRQDLIDQVIRFLDHRERVEEKIEYSIFGEENIPGDLFEDLELKNDKILKI